MIKTPICCQCCPFLSLYTIKNINIKSYESKKKNLVFVGWTPMIYPYPAYLNGKSV